MAKLNQAAIEQHLPHRPPLLLVDTVQAWSADESITASRTFTADEMIFQGHFPDYPILPGMLTIEAMAQAAGLLVNLSRDLTAAQTHFLFMGVEGAKFRQPVTPPTTLELAITQLQRRGDVYKFKGVASLGGATVAEASFGAKVVVKGE